MMSEESTAPDPVELVRRFGEALSVRDFDAARSCFGRGATYDASQVAVGTFEGPAAIGAFLEDWLAAYGSGKTIGSRPRASARESCSP